MLTCVPARADELSRRHYRDFGRQMGVVLFDVNWGRRWNCGDYENAQLLSLRFENVLFEPNEHTDHSLILSEAPSRLIAESTFRNSGYLVEPGRYAFTGWTIRAARSTNDIRNIAATRRELVEGDVFQGGTFSVAAGEVVYIGNFWIDCFESPIPWRFYTELADFDRHSDEYRDTFEFLQDVDIEYRLLSNTAYGETPTDSE